MRYNIMSEGGDCTRKMRGHVKHTRDRECPCCHQPNRLTKTELANGYLCEECEAYDHVRI